VTVICGLTYGWIPYFIIPLYAALARFDTRYLEASRDLGAGTVGTFLHVTLPMSKQGILAGTVLVALPLFGDFFTNGLLSGVSSTAMVGTLINTYAQSQTEQTLAAATAVWLTAFLAILLIPYLRSSARATREVAR
jgi:spermidine/putrescine transport system permease protein